MKDIVHQYIYESEIYRRMMAGREVAQMRKVEGVADMVEEQTGQIMQGI